MSSEQRDLAWQAVHAASATFASIFAAAFLALGKYALGVFLALLAAVHIFICLWLFIDAADEEDT